MFQWFIIISTFFWIPESHYTTMISSSKQLSEPRWSIIVHVAFDSPWELIGALNSSSFFSGMSSGIGDCWVVVVSYPIKDRIFSADAGDAVVDRRYRRCVQGRQGLRRVKYGPPTIDLPRHCSQWVEYEARLWILFRLLMSESSSRVY